jgi:hypothetical protein
MNAYFSKAQKILESIDIPVERKAQLISLTEGIMLRDH